MSLNFVNANSQLTTSHFVFPEAGQEPIGGMLDPSKDNDC